MKFLVKTTIYNKTSRHYWNLDIIVNADDFPDAINQLNAISNLWVLYGVELMYESITRTHSPSTGTTILYLGGEFKLTCTEIAGFKKFLLEAASTELIPGE